MPREKKDWSVGWCGVVVVWCGGGETDANAFWAAAAGDVNAQCRWDEQGQDGLAYGELHGFRARAGLTLATRERGVWGGIRLGKGQGGDEDLRRRPE